jgi:hypothetical protein
MPRISRRIILPTASLAKASVRQITTVRHNYHTHGETTLPRDDNSRLLEQQVKYAWPLTTLMSQTRKLAFQPQSDRELSIGFELGRIEERVR